MRVSFDKADGVLSGRKDDEISFSEFKTVFKDSYGKGLSKSERAEIEDSLGIELDSSNSEKAARQIFNELNGGEGLRTKLTVEDFEDFGLEPPEEPVAPFSFHAAARPGSRSISVEAAATQVLKEYGGRDAVTSRRLSEEEGAAFTDAMMAFGLDPSVYNKGSDRLTHGEIKNALSELVFEGESRLRLSDFQNIFSGAEPAPAPEPDPAPEPEPDPDPIP